VDLTVTRKRAVPLAALLILLAGGVSYVLLRGGDGAGEIRFSGNIEATTVEVSFRIPGRIAERAVDEGGTVAEGQLVARLDNTDLTDEVRLREAELSAADAALRELTAGSRPQEIARAEAGVRGAEARLADLLAGARPQEIASARAAVERARADAEKARKDHERTEALLARQLIPPQENDAARAASGMASARLKEAEEALALALAGPRVDQVTQARAALVAAKEDLSLVKEGARKETVDQARARWRQAGEGLALARTRLSYATVFSPLSGTVLSKNAEPGEFVAAGTPVVTVADLRDVWLRGYIPETDLGKVRLGREVAVTADSYPGKKYEGRVTFIAQDAEFTPKSVQTQKERVKLVYRIKVSIANPAGELKPGMPADGALKIR
jgi:HlyD family secretion protein